MGQNGRSRAADQDGDCRFLGCGMGFMPYLHAPHHEEIPTPTSTLGAATSAIAEPLSSRLCLSMVVMDGGERVVSGFISCGVGKGNEAVKGDVVRLPVKGDLAVCTRSCCVGDGSAGGRRRHKTTAPCWLPRLTSRSTTFALLSGDRWPLPSQLNAPALLVRDGANVVLLPKGRIPASLVVLAYCSFSWHLCTLVALVRDGPMHTLLSTVETCTALHDPYHRSMLAEKVQP